MINCCKTCKAPKRRPGCHDHCKEYLVEKQDYKNRKEKLKEDIQNLELEIAGLNGSAYRGIKQKGRK